MKNASGKLCKIVRKRETVGIIFVVASKLVALKNPQDWSMCALKILGIKKAFNRKTLLHAFHVKRVGCINLENNSYTRNWMTTDEHTKEFVKARLFINRSLVSI